MPLKPGVLRRARKYAEGGAVREASGTGSRGPAPKSHKLVGEFRDPLERAGGLPWLIEYGRNPKNVDRTLGARRWRDPNEELPGNWIGPVTAGLADGGSVIDDLRESLEIRGADQTEPSSEKRAATVRDIASVLPVIGNAMAVGDTYAAGRDAMRAAREGRYRDAAVDTGIAGVSALGALSPVPWGRAAGQAAAEGATTARIFAGPGARTADHEALRRAEEMRWQGRSPDEIWRETGWAWDEARDQPYFEISDDATRLMPGQAQTVGQAIDHPALKAAYPDIADMRFSPESAPANSGAYYRGGNGNPERIALGPGSDATRLNMALHELQHGVQTREAFAPGASAAGYMTERGIDRDQARRLYRRTAGEVQARNVEARRSMTPEERRATPPWATQDTPPDEVYYPSSLHERQDVLVPAAEGPATARARDMRDSGVPMDRIWRETQRTPSPDGSIRREIRDQGMTVNPNLRTGDVLPVSEAVSHPALYDAHPELRDLPLVATDTVDRMGKPIARSIPGGGFQVNPSDDVRRAMAKLFQYGINERTGLASPTRHGTLGRRLDAARAGADALDPANRASVDAYLTRLGDVRDNLDMRNELGTMFGSARAGRASADDIVSRHNAGNLDAHIANVRAGLPVEEMRVWPYARRQGSHNLQKFEDAFVLPPEGLSGPELQAFIDRWHQFGSGRGKFARGGRVARAVRKAKAITGAVRGKTGGREDALPVSVPEGAYVIPADVVAALGEGNTEAGMHRLEKRIGKRQRSGYKSGGAVPILISDGEFVIGPDAVADIGGHDALDAFVTRVRGAYAEHLKGLPGPNK